MPRRRRPRRKRTNRWLILVQILGLTVILVFILLFHDFIAESASDVVSSFGSDDVRVEQDEDEERGEDDEDGERGQKEDSDESAEDERPSFKRVDEAVDSGDE
ncbi:MAG: hypothetical protein ACOCV2_09545 [Persicimonas sp.]